MDQGKQISQILATVAAEQSNLIDTLTTDTKVAISPMDQNARALPSGNLMSQSAGIQPQNKTIPLTPYQHNKLNYQQLVTR